MANATPQPPLPSTAGEILDLHSQTMLRGTNWIFTIAVVSFHLGALAALFYFRWSALLVFLVVWIFA
ncbi:MAG: hypothetical protein RB191_03895, partial [Terriglobia bacterium]|nr:hypothetical protein [Terriglobia bacterium]